MKRVGDLKSIFISDKEIQSLEFAQLVFSFALIQHFFTVVPVFPFGMVMCILILQGLQLRHFMSVGRDFGP